MVSDAERKGVGELQASWGARLEKQRAPKFEKCGGGSSEGTKALWADMPWSLEAMRDSVRGRRAAPELDEPADDDDRALNVDEDDSADEGDVEAALELLDERRFHWRVAGDELAEPFKWCLRGGRWTQENRGTAFDSFRAFFCALAHTPATATFSVRRYEEAGAWRLAKLWCYRL